MKYIIIILLALLSVTCRCQQITITDLIKLFATNEAENELFLNSKEFTLDRLDTKELYSTTWFAYAKRSNANSAEIWVAISHFGDGKKTVLTDFSDIKHFNSQKLLALKLGFKFNRTAKDSETIRFHEYIKGKFILRFWTMIDKEKPDYEISLTNYN